MTQVAHWLWTPVEEIATKRSIFEVDQCGKDPGTKKWGRTRRPNVVEGVTLQAGAEH
jgi:hypothetical protein